MQHTTTPPSFTPDLLTLDRVLDWLSTLPPDHEAFGEDVVADCTTSQYLTALGFDGAHVGFVYASITVVGDDESEEYQTVCILDHRLTCAIRCWTDQWAATGSLTAAGAIDIGRGCQNPAGMGRVRDACRC